MKVKGLLNQVMSIQCKEESSFIEKFQYGSKKINNGKGLIVRPFTLLLPHGNASTHAD